MERARDHVVTGVAEEDPFAIRAYKVQIVCVPSKMLLFYYYYFLAASILFVACERRRISHPEIGL